MPPSSTASGVTKKIVCNWFAKRSQRDSVILVTKVVGPMIREIHIRDGQTRLNRAIIKEGVNGSLQRIQAERIYFCQPH